MLSGAMFVRRQQREKEASAYGEEDERMTDHNRSINVHFNRENGSFFENGAKIGRLTE
jgi:hypothetical protein